MKKEKKFKLEYDTKFDQGIFTIDELIERITKDGYFRKDFWSLYHCLDQFRASLEKFSIGQHENIAYEALWGVERVE